MFPFWNSKLDVLHLMAPIIIVPYLTLNSQSKTVSVILRLQKVFKLSWWNTTAILGFWLLNTNKVAFQKSMTQFWTANNVKYENVIAAGVLAKAAFHIQVNEKFIFTSISFCFPCLVCLSSKAGVSGYRITCAAHEHNAWAINNSQYEPIKELPCCVLYHIRLSSMLY